MNESMTPPRDIIMSESLLQKYATAITTAIFLIVGVTGVLMFFHIGNGAVNEIHEVLGLLFVAAAILHLVRNWNGLVKLLKMRRTQVLCGIAAVSTVFLISFGREDGGNPMMRLIGAIEKAPVESLAPVLGTTTRDLVARLESRGIAVSAPGRSLAQLANDQGMDVRRLFMALVEDGRSRQTRRH